MISLKGFMEQTVTLLADESVENGAFVGMVDNEKVAKSADGEKFIGIAVSCSDGAAAVTVKGYVEANYSGTAPSLGFVKIVADANNGVCISDAGREVLVTTVDAENGKIGFLM